MWKFIFLPAFLIGFFCHGQEIKWDQPIRCGSCMNSIATDSNGDLYIAGEINNSVDNQVYFADDSLPILSQYYNFGFLVKSDKNFNPKWKKVIESNSFFAPRLVVDPSDNLILTGKFRAFLRIDSLEIQLPPEEFVAIVVKFDPDGNLLWYNILEGSTYVLSVDDIKSGPEGEIFLAGHDHGPVVFYNDNQADTLVGTGDELIFLAKYDQGGRFIQAKTFPNGYNQIGLGAIEIDSEKNIYVTGWWSEGGTFESIPKTTGNSDIFIAKFNADMNLEWLKQVGTENNTIIESGRALALDEKLNSLYVTGGFRKDADFGNGIIQANDRNIFLARYSLKGNLIWVKAMGSWSGAASYIEYGTDLFVDSQGFVFLGGVVGRNGYFDGLEISAYDDQSNSNLYFDPIIAKFTASGTLLWGAHFGHPNYGDSMNDLLKDDSNNIYFGGMSQGGAIFDSYTLQSDDYYNLGYLSRIQDREDIVFEVLHSDIHFDADSNLTRELEIIATQYWEITTEADWLHTDIISGTSNTKLTLTAESNQTRISRNAVLAMISESGKEVRVTISQSGQESDDILTAVQADEITDFKIYPNPVEDWLHINTIEWNDPVTVRVVDMQGRTIMEKKGCADIYLKNLPKGVYLLTVETHYRQEIRQFIKE